MPSADRHHRNIVFIVDDDPSIRDSLSLLLSLRGYATAVFASAESFLRLVRPDWKGCVLADIRMPGMSGLEMQRRLEAFRVALPVIIITGHGDIDAARQAFKASASDFLEKPFDDERLVAAIEHAFGKLAEQAQAADAARLPALSQREREVRDLIVDGLDNAAIAGTLGISPRTVEVHKSRLMAKLGVRNLAELVRISLAPRKD